MRTEGAEVDQDTVPGYACGAKDELDGAIQRGLDAVEKLLWRTAKTDQPLITGPTTRLLNVDGRRIRPLFALLSAQFGDPDRPEVTKAATACEVIHMAMLCHEEVLEGDTLQRGIDSSKARWDNNITILAGDMLFAVAAELVAQLGERAVDVYTETTTRMASGQLRHRAGWSPGLTAAQHHARATADHRASLLGAACTLATLAADAPPEARERLRQFAEAYGVADQLAAELRELFDTPGADPAAVWQPLELRATLPALLVRESARAEDRWLRELLDRDLRSDEAALADARELLRRHEAVAYCVTRLDADVEQLFSLLRQLPEHPATDALRTLADTLRVSTPQPREQPSADRAGVG